MSASFRMPFSEPDWPEGDADPGFGQQQYRDWQFRHRSLAELVAEIGSEFPTPSYVGMSGEVTALSLQATYAQMARLERLMADHPDWRPAS
jgi:hypothetical protein